MKIKQDKLQVEVNKIKQEFVDVEHKNDAKINKLDADVKQFNLALHRELNELNSDFEKMRGDLELLKTGMAKVEKQVFVKQKAEYDRLEKLAEKNRQDVSGQLEKVTKEIKDIQQEMLSIVQKANIQIDTSIKHHEKTWSEAVSQQVDSELKTRATDVGKMQEALAAAKDNSDELQDKENRRNYIILYKVPESGAVSADERNNEDEIFCLGLFNVINSGVVKEDITKLI